MPLDPGPGIVNAIWGKTTLEPILKSKPLGEQIDLTTAGLPGYRQGQAKNLAQLESDVGATRGLVNQLSQEDIGTLGSLIRQGASYNPEQSFRNLGDYLTGLWGNAANQIADIGRSRVNLANALTYGGRGGGSYGENVLLNNIARNLAPAWSSTIAQINPAFQSTSADRYRNLGSILDVMGTRAQVPFRATQLSMIPANARTQFLQDEIAALQGLGGAVGQNLAGFQSKDNAIRGAMNAINQSQDDITNLALQAAAMYFGGGAGGAGGMLGGLMGGGGGGARPSGGGGQAPAPSPVTWMQAPPNYAPYASMTYSAPPPPPAPYGTGGYGIYPPVNNSLTYPGYANLFGPSI